MGRPRAPVRRARVAGDGAVRARLPGIRWDLAVPRGAHLRREAAGVASLAAVDALARVSALYAAQKKKFTIEYGDVPAPSTPSTKAVVAVDVPPPAEALPEAEEQKRA